MTTRRELIEAVAARYRAGGRNEKKEILDEFVKVTGFHRKHAIRALKKATKAEESGPRRRSRVSASTRWQYVPHPNSDYHGPSRGSTTGGSLVKGAGLAIWISSARKGETLGDANGQECQV